MKEFCATAQTPRLTDMATTVLKAWINLEIFILKNTSETSAYGSDGSAGVIQVRTRRMSGEGWRRQDLVRFGKYHLAYDMREQLPSERIINSSGKLTFSRTNSSFASS